jgi:SAM-dependent methyltransferase
MTERGGLHQVLKLSWAYTAFQGLVSCPGAADRMRNELYPELGTRPLRVLDIGCGPAAFYSRYRDVAGLEYVGIEPNEAYVKDAEQRLSGIELHTGTVPEVRERVSGLFDLVVLEGVLHHIDDATAIEALSFAGERLAIGGRIVALDPVLLPRQNPIARALAILDRGKHVRTLDGYRKLAAGALPNATVEVRALSGQLRMPYNHSLLTACLG